MNWLKIIALLLLLSCTTGVDRSFASKSQDKSCYGHIKTLITRSTLKYNSILDYFSMNSFGKYLDSHSRYFSRCRGRRMFQVMSKRVARKARGLKRGYFYYIDGLHRDHIEVFDRNGFFSHVMNFDGTFNRDKSLKAYGSGRNIKKCI